MTRLSIIFNSSTVGFQPGKNFYLRRVLLALREAFFDFRVFFDFRLAVAPLRLPPLNTVTGGTTTPV